MNAYGCDTTRNEICHTDICINLTDINYFELLFVLQSTMNEEIFKPYNKLRNINEIYFYRRNTPTLNKICSQLLYITFTTPQLTFINRYLRRQIKENDFFYKRLVYRDIKIDIVKNKFIEDYKTIPDWAYRFVFIEKNAVVTTRPSLEFEYAAAKIFFTATVEYIEKEIKTQEAYRLSLIHI